MTKETLKNTPIKAALATRPPIVVVMGHVDHGKTTLLDYIRKANVAVREAGGITQATAAYEIEHRSADAPKTEAPRKITFIDTPGHEAFTAMRSRGANIADLAILVVAADEGVKTQTKEAIKIILEANTPFIVAINKVDKTNGNLDKARNDLMAEGVLLEGYGGQISYHAVSAKTGEGIDELLDLILLSADLEELTYDPTEQASGYVLEAKRDPKRGIEVTVIIKNGTLERGNAIKTSSASGKVRILEDFLGKAITKLAPSAPAIVIGFENIPKVGEEFAVGELKDSASALSSAAARSGNQIAKSKPNTLNLILKAGDAGSLEALSVVLRGIDQKGGKEINIVEEGVGDISDGDIRHAMATKATIIGFKNRVEKGAKILADAQTVTVITSEIVYDLSTAVEEYFSGARGPAAAGELEVLAIFNQEKPQKQLVGGRVINGTFRGKASFDIVRGHVGSTPVGNGKILGLREKKSEIVQAEKGKEIGVLVDSQSLVQVGDKLLIRK